MTPQYPQYENRKCCPECGSLKVSDTFCIACGAQFTEPSTRKVQIYAKGKNMWKVRETHIFGIIADKLRDDLTITPKQMADITGYSYHLCLKFYREYVNKDVIYTLKGE